MTISSDTSTRHPFRAALGAAAALTATIVGLHLLGRGALAMPRVASLEALREWAGERDPITIAMAAARLLALGVAYHLVATTILAILGKLLRQPGLVRAADAATIPLLRGTVQRTAGVALSLAAVLVGPFAPAAGSGRSRATLAAVERTDPGRADANRFLPSDPVILERIDAASAEPSPATLRVASKAAIGPGSNGRATLRRAAAEPAPEPAVPTIQQHRVEPGDHLWSIAESAVAHHLGRAPTDAEVDPFWRAVVAANPQLAVPDLLLPGELIAIPPVPGTPADDPAGTATLRAEPGG